MEIFDTEKIIIKIVDKYFLDDDNQFILYDINKIFQLHKKS